MADIKDLTRRVERLEAERDITRLRHIYSRGCDDNNNLEILLPLFTDDAVIKLNAPFSGEYKGIEQLAEMYRNNAEVNGVGWTVHYYLQPVIEICEDVKSAVATWYLWEPAMMRLDKKEQEAVLMAGLYTDKYKKIGDEWKIASIEINMTMLAKYADGWSKKRIFGID